MIILTYRFRKASFSKGFLSTLKGKVGVYKFLQFEERFQKAPFSLGLVTDGIVVSCVLFIYNL